MSKKISTITILFVSILMSCSNKYNEENDVPAPVKTVINNAVINEHRIGISLALINKKGTHYYAYGSFKNHPYILIDCFLTR